MWGEAGPSGAQSQLFARLVRQLTGPLLHHWPTVILRGLPNVDAAQMAVKWIREAIWRGAHHPSMLFGWAAAQEAIIAHRLLVPSCQLAAHKMRALSGRPPWGNAGGRLCSNGCLLSGRKWRVLSVANGADCLLIGFVIMRRDMCAKIGEKWGKAASLKNDLAGYHFYLRITF